MTAAAPNMTAGAAAISAHPEFTRLKAKVINMTGLQYYADRNLLLAEHVANRQKALGCPAAEYFRRTLNADDADEFAALIDDITIGETYFFRYPEQFEALRHVLLPDCVLRRQTDKRLRIWSAGCASGAESFSLSILLREHAYALQGWDVSVLGTDINRRALDQARSGVFTNWDLRTVADDIRNRCFVPDGKEWRIRQRYHEGLQFEYLNLATDLENFARTKSEKFDIILCRNVMIYFEPDLMRRVIHCLRECLTDGGWLLVGHAEPYFEIANFLTPIAVAGVTAYRKEGEATAWRDGGIDPRHAVTDFSDIAAVITDGTVPLPPLMAEPPERGAEIYAVASWSSERADDYSDRQLNIAAPASLAPESGHYLEKIRGYVETADWDRALQAAQQSTEQNPMDCRVHYLKALISEHIGAEHAAEVALGRAIYLDRRFALAHYHLGRCQAHRGARDAAIRSFNNSLRALGVHDDATPLLMGDGLSVAELRAIVQCQLELLERLDR